VLAAITGTAGVGKTALAVHVAHQVRERYPDGQLYVNMRGYAAGPSVRPIEALAGFLRALGVPVEQVPHEVGQASALYRSLLADKRVLVLLDNVSHPIRRAAAAAGAAGSLVLVTSRDQLSGLVARDGARRFRLDVLNAGEAHTLLGRLVGPDRVLAELEATAELASLCARLPLALRIAAANLTGQADHSLARYAAELRAGNRLAALVVDGDEETAVRAAIDLSYTAQPEPARRMFRLLGLVPGPDASVEAAAALADVAPAAAAQLLDRLARAHLIDQHTPGRYGFHDLLRLYARTQSTEEDPAADAAAAVERLFRYYLRRAHAAAEPMFGHMYRIPLPEGEPAPEPFPAVADGLAWCDHERANILAAVAFANANGPRRYAWLLTDAIRGYLLLRSDTVDWLAAARVGLSAAEAEDDPHGQMSMLMSLGVLASRHNRHDPAFDYHTRALELARAGGFRRAEGLILLNLGGVRIEQGRLAEATGYHRAALTIHEEHGFLVGQAACLSNLGSAYMYLGRLASAADHFRRSSELAQPGSAAIHFGSLSNYAEACCLLGRLDEAEAVVADALVKHRETGNLVSGSTALRCLAYVEYERGRLDHALTVAEQAVGHTSEAGYRFGEALARTMLATVQFARGDTTPGRDEFGRALALARDAGHQYPEVDALIGLARAERLLGRRTEASGLVEQALAAARAADFEVLEGRALTERAELRREIGDVTGALADAQRALSHPSANRTSGRLRGHPRAPRPVAGRARPDDRARALARGAGGVPGDGIGGRPVA
jgi:tetratricopeptide (TPR) repeat protein